MRHSVQMSHRHRLRHWLRREAALWCLVVTSAAVVGVWAIGLDDVARAREPQSATAASPTPSPPAASGSAATRHQRQEVGPPGAPRPANRTADPATSHWHRVLDRLSRLRAAAWGHGKPGQLRAVYTAAAPELERDQTMLRRYTDRHLRVHGARLVFGRVRLVRRGPHFVVLQAIDQLARAIALDGHGALLQLPRDEPSRHTIELRRSWAGWRIASVQTR